jgi:hypothetical protein
LRTFQVRWFSFEVVKINFFFWDTVSQKKFKICTLVKW